jgi:uncharacterized membrane protein
MGAAALSACGFGGNDAPGVFDAVPERPTYEEHVSLIMTHYCDYCHSRRFPGSKNFRSSTYDSTDSLQGVYEARFRVARRMLDAQPSPMPPPNMSSVSWIDRAIVEKWIDGGAPRGVEPPPEPECDPSARVTYTNDVRPIFAEHCLRCHDSALAEGEERSFANPRVNFDTYEGASGQIVPGISVIDTALRLIKAKSMPADKLTAPTEEQICIIEVWVAQGFPE